MQDMQVSLRVNFAPAKSQRSTQVKAVVRRRCDNTSYTVMGVGYRCVGALTCHQDPKVYQRIRPSARKSQRRTLRRQDCTCRPNGFGTF